MKKRYFTLLVFSFYLLASITLPAQTHGTHSHNPHGTFPPPPQAPSILVQSQNHETFQVYIDGDLVNNVPNQEVLIRNLDSRLHEVVVILTHPAHKAAVTQLYASNPSPIILVSYDMHRQQLLLYNPQPSDYHSHHRHHSHQPNYGTPNPPTIEEPAVASDQWVDEMVSILKGQSFDSEKLTTAIGLLNNGFPLTASQIARIAQTLDFGSSQVDFLKAAYTHCFDPQNYEHALAVLTFSSDRETVRNYISTHQ